MTEIIGGFHARTLRAIGQDLADLLPENLVIEPSGEDFIAHGMCNRERLQRLESGQGTSCLRKISAKLRAGFLKPSARAPDLDLAPFKRTYRPIDVDGLDTKGNQQRIGVGGIPEIYSLAERLRTIGKVLDRQNGRIIRIFKDLHHIICDYRDPDGTPGKIDLDNTELYRLQRSHTSERNDAPGATA